PEGEGTCGTGGRAAEGARQIPSPLARRCRSQVPPAAATARAATPAAVRTGSGPRVPPTPVFTLPRGATCCVADVRVTTRSPVTRRLFPAHRATISYVPGTALGGTRNRPARSSSCAVGTSVNRPAPTAVASPVAEPSFPHAAVFTVTWSPGTAEEGYTSRASAAVPAGMPDRWSAGAAYA